MIFTDTIQKITRINQPQQIEFLEFVVGILEKSPVVSHLLVRGSIATGRADRSSDVDLVVGVQSRAIESFLAMLDSIINIELGCLFPGWYDLLAPNMGGFGFVYLVPFKGILYELDIYVVPEDTIPSIIDLGAMQIHAKSNITDSCEDGFSTFERNIDIKNIIKNDPAQNLVVEILSLLYMVNKRVIRQQWFIVYGLSYLINDALRRLIKHCLIPNSQHWGWYHLEDELGVDPRGRKCLNELSALISILPTPNHTDVKTVFAHIIQIISIANPELWSELKIKLEAYKFYMNIR